MDIWYYFTCHFIDLLKENTGVLTFIATNNWATNFGASVLRNKIISDTKILQLTDFNDFKVFVSAGIQTMIMSFQRNKKHDNYKIDYRWLSSDNTSFDDVVDIIDSKSTSKNLFLKPSFPRAAFIDRYILFAPDNLEKILRQIAAKETHRLIASDDSKRSIISEINQGVVAPQDSLNRKNWEKLNDDNLSVGDGIFILKNEEKEQMNLNDFENQIVKPYFTTNELHRYYGNSNNSNWVIYTDSKFKKSSLLKTDSSIKAVQFPNIKEHLDKFTSVITSSNKPYGLHRSRKPELFEGVKIMALRKCSDRPTFTYTDFPCYVSQSYNIIKTNRINNKYLTAYLNSRITQFWLRYKGKMQGSNYQIDNEPLGQLPIIEIKSKELVINIFDYILLLGQNTSYFNFTTSIKNVIQGFDKLLDCIFFEDIFVDEFASAGVAIGKYVARDFAPITDSMSDAEKSAAIASAYTLLQDPTHELRRNMSGMVEELGELLEPILGV